MSESEAMESALAQGMEYLGMVSGEEFNTARFQDRLAMVQKRVRYEQNGILHEIHIGTRRGASLPESRVHIYARPNIYEGKPVEGLNFLPFHVSGAA